MNLLKSTQPLNWRLFIGSAANKIEQCIISAPFFPLTRYFPRGRSWLYDVARISGSRHFKTVFDVGANTGQTVSAINRYLRCEKVYCFEPVKATHGELLRNHGRDRNVVCIRQALGSAAGRATIRLYGNSEVNTLAIREAWDPQLSEEAIDIDTLDNFCQSRAIQSIDILKMDVQGWEPNILKGAEGLLATGKIRFILSEVGFSSDPDTAKFSDINDTLHQHRFHFCGFYEFFRWGKKSEIIGFANALYMLAS
jgi:FkbM family methyltransferase